MKKLFTTIFIVLIAFSLQAQNIYRTACQGNIERLEAMLDTTDINQGNRKGTTLLLVSTLCRQEKVFEYLLHKGADVTIQNVYGETPLFYAARTGNMMMVKALLARNAKVNAPDDRGDTPLLEAVRFAYLEIVDLLIEHGAEINVVDSFGVTPLHLAVLNGQFEMIQRLVNDETPIDLPNKRGNTPLAIAMRQGSTKIIDFLVDHHADPTKVRSYKLKGKYVGQSKPDSATLFAPNFISTEGFTHSPTFSPNGKACYYTLESRLYHGGTIMVSQLKKGKWTLPQPADIQGDYREIDPFLSYDGTTLFYSSDHPINEADTVKDNIDLWMVKKEGKAWGPPIHLGEEVNTADADWFPSLSKQGRLFFSTGPNRSSNIVCSEFKNGTYQKAVSLGDSVNSEHRDYDPLIAPDESYVIFSSNRPNGFGSVDLYISYQQKDGSWSKATNMGEKVNSPRAEFAPKLSADGKYFFFNRGGDIYWISLKEVLKDIQK